jgi:3-phenylpropionate/cinnamic acid dioxygenase small subunit
VTVAREQIEAFLYREARLQDEHHYAEWEALWTDDAVYWVPAGDDVDPSQQVSIVYDNRARIATRVKQLTTGEHYAQTPPSRVRRLISNVELLEPEAGDEDGDATDVGANFVAYELRLGVVTLWAGRALYRLRLVDGELRLVRKKVLLVNNAEDVMTLAFLI